MELGLTNVKLSLPGSGSSIRGVKRVKPARPSIAEDAIFIPKPRERVHFDLKKPNLTSLSGSDSNTSPEDIPLLGESSDQPEAYIKANLNNPGSLGPNGVTAQITKETYQSMSAVEVDINNNAQKDFSVIATQEEGRQVNHAQIHYTQQMDSYGRPIIGFSREPYDFAAIKYMSITSQVKFQENMEDTRKNYDQYFLGKETPSDPTQTEPDPTELPQSPFASDKGQEVTLPESPFKTDNNDFDPTKLPENPFSNGSILNEGQEDLNSTYDAPTAKEISDQQAKARHRAAYHAAQSFGAPQKNVEVNLDNANLSQDPGESKQEINLKV